MQKIAAIILGAVFVVIADSAQAYIGPGLGAGAIGAILGVLAAVGLAIFAIFWYPIKRMLKKRRAAKSADQPADKSGAERS